MDLIFIRDFLRENQDEFCPNIYARVTWFCGNLMLKIGPLKSLFRFSVVVWNVHFFLVLNLSLFLCKRASNSKCLFWQLLYLVRVVQDLNNRSLFARFMSWWIDGSHKATKRDRWTFRLSRIAKVDRRTSWGSTKNLKLFYDFYQRCKLMVSWLLPRTVLFGGAKRSKS